MAVPKRTPDGEDFSIDRFMQRRRSLRNDYATYQEHYAEISQHFRPRRGNWIRDNADASVMVGQGTTTHSNKTDGKKRHQHIINSTPLRVAKNAQSGLQAGVTSPSRPWKKIGPVTQEHLEIPGARQAFEELDKRMDFVLQKSNFYRSTHTAYADFVDYGSAAIQIDEHEKDVIRCAVHPVGSWVCAVNADGRVDAFYRDYRLTGREPAPGSTPTACRKACATRSSATRTAGTTYTTRSSRTRSTARTCRRSGSACSPS